MMAASRYIISLCVLFSFNMSLVKSRTIDEIILSASSDKDDVTSSAPKSIDEVILRASSSKDDAFSGSPEDINDAISGSPEDSNDAISSSPKSIDEVILRASGGIEKDIVRPIGSNSGIDQMPDNEGRAVKVYDLDMRLIVDQYKYLLDPTKLTSNYRTAVLRNKRKARRSLAYRWTNKEIPYEINSNIFTRRDVNEIEKAITEWEENTCLKFRLATSSDKNKIVFDGGPGCYSSLGMVGGTQVIGLAPRCRLHHIILHQIGHAVGFIHEHNRPDRDRYVRIHYENIPFMFHDFFRKEQRSITSTYGLPYDYESVMHFRGMAFSQNGKITIETKDKRYQNVIGNSNRLSSLDIKLANLMYACS